MAQAADEQIGRERSRAASRRLVIHWGAEANEQNGPMRWLGSWLVGNDGREAAWFHSGFGDEATEHEVPADAIGVRIRRWVSEGLDPEYIDVACNGDAEVSTDTLDFDAPQAHRVLAVAAQ